MDIPEMARRLEGSMTLPKSHWKGRPVLNNMSICDRREAQAVSTDPMALDQFSNQLHQLILTCQNLPWILQFRWEAHLINDQGSHCPNEAPCHPENRALQEKCLCQGLGNLRTANLEVRATVVDALSQLSESLSRTRLAASLDDTTRNVFVVGHAGIPFPRRNSTSLKTSLTANTITMSSMGHCAIGATAALKGSTSKRTCARSSTQSALLVRPAGLCCETTITRLAGRDSVTVMRSMQPLRLLVI